MTFDPTADLGYEFKTVTRMKDAQKLMRKGWEKADSAGKESWVWGSDYKAIMRRPISPDSREGKKVIAERARERAHAERKAEEDARKAEAKVLARANYKNGVDDGKLTARNLVLRNRQNKAEKAAKAAEKPIGEPGDSA